MPDVPAKVMLRSWGLRVLLWDHRSLRSLGRITVPCAECAKPTRSPSALPSACPSVENLGSGGDGDRDAMQNYKRRMCSLGSDLVSLGSEPRRSESVQGTKPRAICYSPQTAKTKIQYIQHLFLSNKPLEGYTRVVPVKVFDWFKGASHVAQRRGL